jgi:catechol 2,3-dioxygenase
MTMTQTQSTISPYSLEPTTKLGHVRLTVASLDRQIAFYTQGLGFALHWREGTEAALGTATDVLLRLTENPTARRVQGSAGMYHFAILYPSERELARAIARLFAMRYPNAPTDHGVSKTTYLDDLEGNNIELYVRTLDRAVFEVVNGQMSVRYADGSIGSGRDPLDLDALFSTLNQDEQLDLPLPDGTVLGHVHLYASSLDDSMHFYHDVLGFQEGMTIPGFRMSDVGLTDDQPHVVAFNTWKGEGIPAPRPDTLGMQYFSIVLPDATTLTTVIERIQQAGIPTTPRDEGTVVHDPSGISVLLTDHTLPISR